MINVFKQIFHRHQWKTVWKTRGTAVFASMIQNLGRLPCTVYVEQCTKCKKKRALAVTGSEVCDINVNFFLPYIDI